MVACLSLFWLPTLLGLAGCRATLAPEAIEIHRQVTSQPAETPFEDLSAVLAAAVDDHGNIDPTALATVRPRLELQLAKLAQPWPAEVREGLSNKRLAWLYNARAAWSLRLAARELRSRPSWEGGFELPECISYPRLMLSSFVLDGRPTTLADLDKELARFGDFRIVVSAPDATDYFGRLPKEPFSPIDVREKAEVRFSEYVRDERRFVVDYSNKQVRISPALETFATQLRHQYEQRYGTPEAALATALTPYVDRSARKVLEDALGYAVVLRTDPPGIVTADIPVDRSRRQKMRLDKLFQGLN